MSKKEGRKGNVQSLSYMLILPSSISTSSGSMIHLWASYHPVSQTEVGGPLREAYPEPLVKRPKPLEDTTIRVSYNPLGTGE